MNTQDADSEQYIKSISKASAIGDNVQKDEVGYRGTSVSPEDVTVLIPTLNESEGIGFVIDDLKREGFSRILVVDGGSIDETRRIAADKGVFVVTQHGNGKAGAIRTALDLVTTPYMAVLDGDCTYSAADLRNLLSYAKNYNEVIGARFKGRKNIPSMNRFGNWLVSKAFKLLFSSPVSDVLSGMYIVRADALRAEGLMSQSFDIEVEIAAIMASSGRITEVPIGYGPRKGRKKLSSRHGFRILSTLLWMTYYESPLYLFGILSAILAIPAIGVLLWVAYQALMFGIFHSGYAIFGVALLLIVTQGMSVALMSLVTKRTEHRLRAAIEKQKRR